MGVKVHNGEPTVRVRSLKWTTDRIEMLKAKKKTLKNDFEIRSANVDEELALRTKELKTLKK